MARVRIDSGPHTGTAVELKNPKTVFGRHESCDCVISHPTVSRHHFFIESAQGKHFVVDQNSGNGTYVNDEKVTWVELKDGDVIQAGPFALVFEDPEQNSPVAQTKEEPGLELAGGFKGEYPREYLVGIDHFNAGRYFEAHEIWEEIWLRSSDVAKIFYQMLIQSAVGLLHFERGNYAGARGMYANVIEKLATLPGIFMSLDVVDFDRQFREFFEPLRGANWQALPDSRAVPRIQLRSVEERN
jgi:hypothetical protein